MRFLLPIIIFQSTLLMGQVSEQSNSPNAPSSPLDTTLINSGKLLSPYLGYMYNWNGNHFVEFGFVATKYQITGFHLFSGNISLSGELRVNKWNELLYGPKLSIWMSGGSAGMVLGGSLINYRFEDENIVIFRPELGIGILGLKFGYGRNIPILNSDLMGLARHNLFVIVPFKYE